MGDFKNIEKDIENRFNKALKEMADNLTFEIDKAYEETIQKFYDDYSPKWYERTYSTFGGAFPIYDIMDIGDTYFSGIKVDSGYIPGNPYRMPTTWVFDRTFYEGIHGVTAAEVRERNRGKHKNEEIKLRAPKKMRPSPKALMDKEFKKITKKKNMDKLFNEAMSKVFS